MILSLPLTADTSTGHDEDALARLRTGTRRRADREGTAVLVHPSSPVHLALALAGGPPEALEAPLQATIAAVYDVGTRDLVVDLAGLDASGPGATHGLARVLGRLRIRALVAGTRVEIREAPAALTHELGGCAAEAFEVTARA